MKYLVVFLLLMGGCVATVDKATISYQAARFDRAVALINSGGVTQKQEEDFIRGERKVWHALDYSVNGNPLPPDLQTDPSKPKASRPTWPDTVPQGR